MILRAGLVGTGAISRFHVQALRRLTGVEIVGVTDVDHLRAESFAREQSLTAYRSLQNLVNAGANVVHVLTPPSSHATIAVQALELGCDVFVEKPLATSVEDCDSIAAAEQQSGKRVCVGHSLLYDPFVRRALNLVQQGVIGDVLTFDYHRCINQQSYPASGLSTDQKRGGYPFRDIGIHALYLAEAFVGPIAEVEAWPIATGRGDVNLWVDEWRVLGKAEHGTAQLQLSWNVRPQQNFCIIQGTKGTIRVDLFGMSVTVKRQRGVPEHAARVVNTTSEGVGMAVQAAANVARVATKRVWQFHGLQALVAEFYAQLRQQSPPPVTVAEARRTVYWTEVVAQKGDAVKDAWMRSAQTAGIGATTLVTGSSGFIGRHLVQRLLSDGQAVRLFVRRPAPKLLAGHPRVEVVIGDLGDAAAVRQAMEGIRTVFHVGAAMRGSGPEFERSTVTGTGNIVRSCVEQGVDKLIYMSSLAVIDTDAGRNSEAITESSALETRTGERGHYTRTKLEAEQIVLEAVRTNGLPAIVLRPGEVVSAEKPLLTAGVAQRVGNTLIVLGNGKVRLPLVHVSDVVDALMSAQARPWTPGTIVQLVEDADVTQNDIIAHYASTTSDRVRVLRIPLPAVIALSAVVERVTKRLLGRAPIGPRRIRAATNSRRFDCARAKLLLGWEPRARVASAFVQPNVHTDDLQLSALRKADAEVRI